ncbi:beta-galactosidase [Cohnella sp. SGD-V74]|uniref:beta-galactosidase n=1 Tax=unclassified Cohnella TaxID=2636738 RepID=UPI000D4937A0|nr:MULTISPECIES: beta-galactosidase [unclassified Cohnella]PRX66426.1 beta-galactosidase [Cohnella sp. SGD-V74]
MKLGVAYYPEHHKPEQWPIDYRKIKEAGIERIRIAEFAWACLEPEEGRYEWRWLDEAIALATDFGLQVVLCTPTACPPIWLVEQHPEVLPVHRSGKTVGFGARQHRSYSSPKYIEYSMRIVERMAERYGQHPNVVAWQLDNEFGGETKFDYGECSRRAFHLYLEQKYGTIDELNERWGTVFWSQTYRRFEQIPLPAPIESDVMMWQHPSLELEFARFSSDVIVRYANRQTDALRRHIGDRPITTNAFMFKYGDSVDWIRLFEKLDVVGMDIYSDRPHEIAFYCDASRGVLAKPFWMMEYGAGTSELERDIGIVRERGCEHFYLFKMKPFPWGQEQGAGGDEMLTLTGEPSANYGVVQRYSREGAALPASSGQARVALFYHFESSWSYRISVADRLPYPEKIVDNVYRALYESGEPVDVLYTPGQIADHEALLVPYHVLYDPELEERLIAYVRAGGKLIVTSDLFRKNADNVFLTEVPRLFAELLDWQENNFVQGRGHAEFVIRSHGGERGGRAWIVARDGGLEDWRMLLSEVLAVE